MNIPFLCVFLAFVMNYLTKIPVAMAMAKQPSGYDNHQPREQQAKLTGWGKRALGAHLNSFEIFPAFAIAVIMAHISGVDENKLALLSVTYILSRICYTFLYLTNKSTLRSLAMFIGAICVCVMFGMAIF